MGLEYDSLADYSLQESPFYESTLDIYDMSTTQLSGKLGSTLKRKKNKKVTFLSSVQVCLDNCYSLYLLLLYINDHIKLSRNNMNIFFT